MMLSPTPKISTLTVLLALVSMATPAAAKASRLQGASANSTSSSPWLRKLSKVPREGGCGGQPWVCREPHVPPFRRRLCCKNRCVDVGLDENNCGFCGIRCPFSWRCCGGFCVNTNLNSFHCGSCFKRCPFGAPCLYGMCGYALPQSPSPLITSVAESSRRAPADGEGAST